MRYSQVSNLVEGLQQIHPGSKIPRVSQYSLTANMLESELLTVNRKIELEEILNYIGTHALLGKTELFAIFIENPSSMDKLPFYYRIPSKLKENVSFFQTKSKETLEKHSDEDSLIFYMDHIYFVENLIKSVEAYQEYCQNLQFLEQKTTDSLETLRNKLNQVDNSDGIFENRNVIKEQLDMAELSCFQEAGELKKLEEMQKELLKEAGLIKDLLQRRELILKMDEDKFADELKRYYEESSKEFDKFKECYEQTFTELVERTLGYIKMAARSFDSTKKVE